MATKRSDFFTEAVEAFRRAVGILEVNEGDPSNDDALMEDLNETFTAFRKIMFLTEREKLELATELLIPAATLAASYEKDFHYLQRFHQYLLHNKGGQLDGSMQVEALLRFRQTSGSKAVLTEIKNGILT